jgi:hypothetical protein
MQTFLAMITIILAVLGIGFDDKVNIITFNVAGTHAIKANCYSRHTGLTEEVEIMSKQGEGEEEQEEDEGERGMSGVKYKLLGIKFTGAYPDPTDNARKVAMYRFLIRKVLWRKLPMGLITQLLEQGVISKFVVYGVLLNTLTDENLAKMDTLMAALGKHSMGLPVSAPRGTPFAPRNSYGAGMPSAVTHFIAGTARELYVLLNQKGYLGVLARNAVAYAIENTDRLGEAALKNSIIVAAANRLSRWGIQCSCALEPLVSRMRDELLRRRTRGNPTKMVPCFTARCDENTRAFRRQEVHSFFGNIAKCIRQWDGIRVLGDGLVPLQPGRQVRNPNDIGLPELQEVILLAKERDQKDFKVYVDALGFVGLTGRKIV